MHENIKILIDLTAQIMADIGYLGIFLGMFIESTIIPLPSELIMIPAGIACAKNLMNIYLVISFGIAGNVLGAIFSYYLASSIGRSFLFKAGKYFFIKPSTIIKIEKFFNNYGPISIFFARLLPGFRHFISIPAGIARMDMKLFFIYTFLGSSIWTIILALAGYFIGENHQLIGQYLKEIIKIIFGIIAIILIYYYFFKNKKNILSI
jgi:membrane protein DedA with SNARE-associated domain